MPVPRWDYRVVKSGDEYVLLEVYYNKDGIPWFHTYEQDDDNRYETIEEMRDELNLRVLALSKPVLQETDFPQEGTDNGTSE